jgi:LmbE family N-acetylglucosaminyl deacetylase
MMLLCSTAQARQPSAAELARAIDRLAVTGSVLYVAAHPDDENTRLLAWLVNERLVRAAYLSLTRGEGGQNLIGSEQAPLLGVIRTQELLAARSIDGAEQLFTNVRDFGYSKSAEETLRIWDHDAALADVVAAIDKFHPDVIVTRFSPEDRDTHGHHTSSAMLALEAFRAAHWKAKRILWNRGVWPGSPAPDASFAKLDVSAYNPVLGESYGEMAARSRSMHKSQGFGVAPNRGQVFEYFKVLDGEPIKESFLDGVDLSWRRVKGADKIPSLIAKARSDFRLENPAAAIPALLELERALDKLPDDPIARRKLTDVRELIAACAGIHAEARAADFAVSPGQKIKITGSIVNRSDATVELVATHLFSDEKSATKRLERNKPFEVAHEIVWSGDFSQPYWLSQAPLPGRWASVDHLNEPEAPAPSFEFILSFGGQRFSLMRPIAYYWTDPVNGERRRPVETLPEVTLATATPLLLFPDGKAKELRVTVRASTGPAEGAIKPKVPEGWHIEPASAPYKLDKRDAQAELVFHVRPPPGEAEGTLELGGRVLTRIEYPHIPIQTLTPAAEVHLVRADVKRSGARIGYIPGAGDEVPRALEQAGYSVTMLNDEALQHDPLKYDAIVIGVRAFNVNEKLARFHDKLMNWVAAGGTLVAQYNTAGRQEKASLPIGPAPFAISHERVTEENAAVELLAPKHPMFNTPNKIEPRDFVGWLQERGLYFAGEWDKTYTPLLSMHDAGEPARKGALLVAKHGKGTFVYTGLAFFRQLPAGVPGAFRLFANLIAKPQK